MRLIFAQALPLRKPLYRQNWSWSSKIAAQNDGHNRKAGLIAPVAFRIWVCRSKTAGIKWQAVDTLSRLPTARTHESKEQGKAPVFIVSLESLKMAYDNGIEQKIAAYSMKSLPVPGRNRSTT